jgi:hypothetical protein
MILSLFNESEDPLSNNEMIEISIPPIDFNRDEYKLLSIFIYHCPNILALTVKEMAPEALYGQYLQ